LTFDNQEKLLRDEVSQRIEKFPYVIVNDTHRVLDPKTMIEPDVDVIPYESEKDYANVRLKSELAKAFKLRASIFLFRDKSAERYFADLYTWFERIDVDEKIVELFSERLNEHVGVLKPLLPLIIRIFKENKMDQLVKMSARLVHEERPKKLHVLRDFLLSVLLDQEISGEDVKEKTCKLFTLCLDPQKYDYLQTIVADPELREFVEAVFAMNKTLRKCLIDRPFRNNICTLMLAMHCIKNFPEKRRELILPLLFERYELKEKELKEEATQLYDTVANELPVLCERISHLESFQSLNKFVRDYEKQWFGEPNTISEFESSIEEYQGLLISESDYLTRKIRTVVENVSITAGDTDKLRNVLSKLGSWSVVKSSSKFQNDIKNLDNLIWLTNLTIVISGSNPRSWDEWVNLYESYILQGDKLLSNFKREPAILETSTYKVVTKRFSEARSTTLENYETFLLRNYPKWADGDPSRPRMVTDILNKINSLLRTHDVIFLIVYDGMRVDFWNVLKEELEKGFKITEERILSVIPSETVFSRRAIFAGCFPQDFDSFDEPALMKKKRIVISYEKGRIEKFNELLNEREKVRVLVYGLVDEIGHRFQEGLSIALENFKPIAQRHAKFYEKVKSRLNELGRVAIVIASDHGFIQASELKQIDLPSQVDWLYPRFSPRFVVFGVQRRAIAAPYEVEDLMAKLEERDLGYFVKDPKKLKIVKADGCIEVSYDASEQVVHPLFLLFAKSEIRFFRLGGRGPPEFAHGGLSPHETIVPFAVLEPK
jgi:hypothetical protein